MTQNAGYFIQSGSVDATLRKVPINLMVMIFLDNKKGNSYHVEKKK